MMGLRRRNRMKTPSVLQMEAVECGAAALGMILGFFGKHVPLEELRYQCGVSRDGSKATNIIKAARGYGMEARGFRMSIQTLKEQKAPVILFWGFEHFVVYEGYHRSGKQNVFWVNDPASGALKIPEQEFSKSFTGVVLTFRPTPDFQPGGKPVASWKILLHSFLQDKIALIFLLLAVMTNTFFGILIPTFSRIFVDHILIPQNTLWLAPLLSLIAITALISGLISWLTGRTLLKLENKISISFASSFFHHVIRLPISFFSQRYAGNISAILPSGEQMAKLLTSRMILSGIQMLFSVVYVWLMFQYDVILAITSLVFAFGNLFLVRFFSHTIKADYKKLMNDEGRLSGIAMSGIQAIESLKSTGQESVFFTRLVDQYSTLQNLVFRLHQKELLLNSIPRIAQVVSVALLLAIGGLRIIDGSMSIGAYVAFQILTASFYLAIQQFGEILASLWFFEAVHGRMQDVDSNPEDPYLAPRANDSYDRARLSGKIEIRDLTFGYNRNEPPLIEGFHLQIEPGQKIALVGSSGSGKSTIARLVSGLLRPWDGQILFDGTPIDQIPLPLLTASIAYVEQEGVALSGTIRDNLSLWDNLISEKDMIEAAKDAHVHDEITALVGDYDHPLQEFGRNLSGGIRQRLEIARCLARKPSILILDEATSALDARTEMDVERNLDLRGYTRIVVSHRLSTIRDCDQIIVLEDGKAVERGSHQELVEKKGAYARLIAM